MVSAPISRKPRLISWIKNKFTSGEAHEKDIATGNHGEKRKMQSQPFPRRRGRPFETLNYSYVVERSTSVTYRLRPVSERHEVENGSKTASADLRKGEEHETVELVSTD